VPPGRPDRGRQDTIASTMASARTPSERGGPVASPVWTGPPESVSSGRAHRRARGRAAQAASCRPSACRIPGSLHRGVDQCGQLFRQFDADVLSLWTAALVNPQSNRARMRPSVSSTSGRKVADGSGGSAAATGRWTDGEVTVSSTDSSWCTARSPGSGVTVRGRPSTGRRRAQNLVIDTLGRIGPTARSIRWRATRDRSTGPA